MKKFLEIMDLIEKNMLELRNMILESEEKNYKS